MEEPCALESEDRDRRALEIAGDGVWDWNVATGGVWLSPRWLEAWGYAPGDIEPTLGSWRDLVHPDDLLHATESMERHLSGETPIYEEEYRLRTKSGDYRWNRSRAQVTDRDARGRPHRVVGIDADVTSRRKTRESSVPQTHIYRQLFDHMNEGFGLHEVICDAQGRPHDYRFLVVNREFEELTGLKADAILGRTVREVLPDIDAHWIEELGQVGLTGRPAQIERYSTPLARYFRVSAFCPSKGRFACVFTDVTGQKQLVESLRESQARFRATFEWASAGIALVDPDGRYIECNPALEKILGCGTDELRGLPFAKFTHPEDVEEDWTRFRDLMSGRRDHYTIQKRFLRTDATLMWGHVVVSVVRTDDGAPDYAIRMVEDISEQKRAEEDLLALNADLENRVMQRTEALDRANRELEAFSYSVSHDLRAPVRHVTGYVELLERHMGTVLDDKGRRYVSILADSAHRMGQLIDDLLEFSRTGRAELQTTIINLDALVDEVRRECLVGLERPPVVWKVSALPEVRADRSLLRLALVNLVSNALKFTRTRVEAVIEIGEESSDDGTTAIFVRDNGVGFDAKYVDKLFGVFRRLHTSEAFEGTGIGLANVKRIVERHGGRVWAEGAVDRGATFYFTLSMAGTAKEVVK